MVVIATRDAHREVPLHTACLLDGRVHGDSIVIRDHDHDVLGQVLRTLAL